MMQKKNVIVTLTVVCSSIMEELKDIFFLVIGEQPCTIQLVRTKFFTIGVHYFEFQGRGNKNLFRAVPHKCSVFIFA